MRPFLALRSYLPADHPDKALEMGSEPTPGAFIDALLTLTEECRRVLTPHGSLCVELGDTYAGSGGAGGDYGPDGMRGGQTKFHGSALADRKNKVLRADGNRLQQGTGWPLDKSLCLIPELYRVALVYGFNPLTGRTTPRWRARNVVRWARPNPPVGALGDKFRPATSEMVVACVGRKRYFDLDAVRTEAIDQRHRSTNGTKMRAGDPAEVMTANYTQRIPSNVAGAPPLDWWAIPTEPYRGSHYATWPSDLLVRPIRAMCPERVCQECGVPSERIVRLDGYTDHNGVLHLKGEKWSSGVANGGGAHSNKPGSRTTTTTTTGWTDCGHNAYRPGIVLDPFAGSGTTLAVATGHGRDATGIDLDERNADLARQRVGMFLTVEHFATEVPA